MNKIIYGLIFLLTVSSFNNNLQALSFPDTIVVKRGQPDSVISGNYIATSGADTSDECDVYLKNRSLLKEVRMVSVNDSNLLVIKDSVRRVLNTTDVMKIVFRGGAGFVKGAIFGMGLSLGVWGTIGATTSGSNGFGVGLAVGLIYGLPAVLVGGFVGVLADRDDVYYLMHMKNTNKIKRIKYIISKHK